MMEYLVYGREDADLSSEESFLLPVSVFNNSNLSSLEAITKYLKEEKLLSFREIGILLHRDERTIWGAYNSSKQKMDEPFRLDDGCFSIPLPILQDRTLSVLENITEFLKEAKMLRYCQIAAILNRNDRTIWTVYKRAKKKRRNRYEGLA